MVFFNFNKGDGAKPVQQVYYKFDCTGLTFDNTIRDAASAADFWVGSGNTQAEGKITDMYISLKKDAVTNLKVSYDGKELDVTTTDYDSEDPEGTTPDATMYSFEISSEGVAVESYDEAPAVVTFEKDGRAYEIKLPTNINDLVIRL